MQQPKRLRIEMLETNTRRHSHQPQALHSGIMIRRWRWRCFQRFTQQSSPHGVIPPGVITVNTITLMHMPKMHFRVCCACRELRITDSCRCAAVFVASLYAAFDPMKKFKVRIDQVPASWSASGHLQTPRKSKHHIATLLHHEATKGQL